MSSQTFHNHPHNIGDRIREAREHVNLSRVELAEKLGVSRQAVGHWERGKYIPDMENLVAIALLTKQPLDWFVGRLYNSKGNLVVTLDGYAADVIRKRDPSALL